MSRMLAQILSMRHDRKNPGRSHLAAVLAVVISVAAPGTAVADGHCSVEEHGEPAYARVTEKVREKLHKFERFDFDPYEEVDISLAPGCVLKLRGGFTFKKQRNQEARVYDAEATPKAGAPGGIKILKLQISR